jgi:hypothetical protein
LKGVRDYILSGADLNVKNHLGQTAAIIGILVRILIFNTCLILLLHLAAINNYQVILRYLIAAAANLDIQDINGDTALILGMFLCEKLFSRHNF